MPLVPGWWREAVLTALAVPLAIGITDYVLKPTIGEAIGAAFPAGTPPAVSRWRPQEVEPDPVHPDHQHVPALRRAHGGSSVPLSSAQ
ncbi:MAG: hypothetical protein ACRDPF_37750 [Streptosporangiaceae bacterium]